MMFICWITRERSNCALREGGSVNVTVPCGAEAVRSVIITSVVVRGWQHEELVLCLQVCVASESVTACPGEAGLVALRCVFRGILQVWSEWGEIASPPWEALTRKWEHLPLTVLGPISQCPPNWQRQFGSHCSCSRLFRFWRAAGQQLMHRTCCGQAGELMDVRAVKLTELLRTGRQSPRAALLLRGSYPSFLFQFLCLSECCLNPCFFLSSLFR